MTVTQKLHIRPIWAIVSIICLAGYSNWIWTSHSRHRHCEVDTGMDLGLSMNTDIDVAVGQTRLAVQVEQVPSDNGSNLSTSSTWCSRHVPCGGRGNGSPDHATPQHSRQLLVTSDCGCRILYHFLTRAFPANLVLPYVAALECLEDCVCIGQEYVAHENMADKWSKCMASTK